MATQKSKNKTTTQPATEPFGPLPQLHEIDNYRTKESIDGWRNAQMQAEALILPNYEPLYKLYREISEDAHISGLVSQRINRLLGSQFRLVKDDGTEDTDAYKIFERQWFYRFLELAMESRWWHHSLIQLWEPTQAGYASVELVNRNHVLPRSHQVTVRAMDTTSAIDYHLPEYFDYLIECGNPKDLGLYNRAAPHYLIKKQALLEWSKHAQIFGAPFRWATSASPNAADMQQIATRLEKMAHAAYAVLPTGTELKFLETTKTDAYQIYMQLVLTPNSELSKLFLGQTMTTDNGSSRSQGEVHERVADSVADADKRFIQFLVNDELIPRMLNHGFKGLTGLRFEWAPVKDLKGQMELVKSVLPYMDIDPKYIEETFGIPVMLKQQANTDPNTDPNADPQQQPPVKKKVNLAATLNALYAGACTHIHLAAGDGGPDEVDMDALARFIYDNRDNPDMLHTETYLSTAQSLLKGFKGGFGSGFEEQGATGVRAAIKQNIYPFSAAKTLTQMQQMRNLLEADGKLRSFTEFKAAVTAEGIAYNRTWLQAEYNHAVASGQMADRWKQYEADADLYPNLRYKTAEDERVREAHRKLNDIVKPIGDSFWNTYYPPNDWGCRCDVEQEADDTPVTEGYPTNSKKAVAPLFRNNVGKTNVVFKDEHPYMEENGSKAKLLNYKNYNLKPLEAVKRLPTASAGNIATKAEFNQWAAANTQFTAFDGEVFSYDARALQKQAAKKDGQHWEVSSNLADLLANPSEAYQLPDPKSGVITRTFFKHYQDRTLVAAAELKNDKWILQTWYAWDGIQNQNDKRQGALLWLFRK